MKKLSKLKLKIKSKAIKFVTYFLGIGHQLIENDKSLELQFEQYYSLCKPFTMTSKERLYALYKSVNYILDRGIDGVFVECGVWRGGSAMMIMLILSERGISDRDLYLYDTFEGMTMPTESDFSIGGKNMAYDEWEKNNSIENNLWCYASQEDVLNNLNTISYPLERIHFIKGKVEDTIPEIKPEKISLLRLDTDWYESTKHELIYLFPILTSNGVLIIDDYGHWAGAKKAVDEYFSNSPLLFNRVDYSCRVAVKN